MERTGMTPMENRRHQKHRNHCLGEWWSSILLVMTGIYALAYFMAGNIFHCSFVNGFRAILPACIWEGSFILTGTLQLVSLMCGSFRWRGVASFLAASLFIWGVLNMLVYERHWHFGIVAWGTFALVNLYTLARILAGVIRDYEYSL